MARRKRTNKSPRRSASGSLSRRAKMVWLALTGSMTAVGGMLLVVDGKPAPHIDGLSLPPLLASGSNPGVESVFATRKPLDKKRWTTIVIHHSGETFGSPTTIEAEHQKLRFKGLGHHFVIGNGKGMDDGELHVGFRWLDQLPGAHAGGEKGDYYNNHAISICLVGNGDRQPFTKSQLSRLATLVSALCRELDISPDHVKLHSDVAGISDPGRLFPQAWFHQRLAESN